MKNVLSIAALLYIVYAGPVEVMHNVVTLASMAGVLPVQLVSR